VHIALVGEIYTMIEPFSNLHIEDKLMELGACTTRALTPSWWIRDLALKPFGLNSPRVRLDSKKYLPVKVGGHAKETVAHVVQAEREMMDGVIQLFPLGCMPEIVTKAVIPAIQKEKGIPIMTLVVDEVTGEAGYLTRIEAFLDMLEAKKNRGEMRA
jgi:predicted nucleotide-binding protein (sugar kinase/HSP70/actin superfamily)